MSSPDPSTPWDDDAAASWSSSDEIDLALSTYTAAFLATIAPPPSVGPLLARLAARYTLGICSNWPLGVTIDRFVEQAGWASHLAAIVVSQRVGTIKPAVRIFRATEVALGTPPAGILHVGDDWLADIVGAKQAGWLAAYLMTDGSESPFPVSERDSQVEPDLRLTRLTDLERSLA
jgi:putative hydrolase of the HAD superfamily